MTEDLSKLKIESDKRGKPETSRTKNKRFIFIVLAILLAALLSFYRYIFYAVPVTVRPLEVHELGLPPVMLTAGGYIVANPQLKLSSKIPGQIRSLPVKEGDVVKAGTLLAEIAADDLAVQAEATQRAADLARDHHDRLGALYQAGAISKHDLEEAEIEFKTRDAQAKAAAFTYSQTRIVAPIDGTIIRILRKEGELLSPGLAADGEPGTSILSLGNLSRMQVELDINEADISRLRIGQPALIFPDAYATLTIHGHITDISPMANRQKSIVPVKVSLDDLSPETPLKPDMAARVIFLEKEMTGTVERVLLVPETAIQKSRGLPYIFVVENERAIRTPVLLGDRVNNSFKLKTDLKPGTAVVLNPPFNLRDKRRVEIKGE